jgi:hypothetical protein
MRRPKVIEILNKYFEDKRQNELPSFPSMKIKAKTKSGKWQDSLTRLGVIIPFQFRLSIGSVFQSTTVTTY